MRLFPCCLLLWLLSVPGQAQTNTLPARIAGVRLELQRAFTGDDPAAAALWMDSLSRLENDAYVGLVWDERWLLYLWEEAYGNLFDEVMRFDAAERERQASKIAPRQDSLFETIDRGMYEQRFEGYNRLQRALLNEEEKAFVILQLDYLLRLNQEEKDWSARLEAFLKRYPNSRFADFIRAIKPVIRQPGQRGFGMALSLANGQWTNQLDRSLQPLIGLQGSFYLWRRGWHLGVEAIGGSPALRRTIRHNGFDWPKKDVADFFMMGLEAGRDVLHTERLRVAPVVGAYFSTLSPAVPEEGENPDYYSDFYFGDGHLMVGLITDVKLFKRDWNLQGIEKGTFHGIRLQLGYHWLRLDRKNAALEGNMFFFALGYHLFVQRPAK